MSTTTERFIHLYEDLVEEVNRRAKAASSHSFEIEQARSAMALSDGRNGC